MRIISFLLIMALAAIGYSQATYDKSSFKITKSATIDPGQITDDFDPTMLNLEAPTPGGTSYRSYLMELKKEIKNMPSTGAQPAFRGAVPTPIIQKRFRGNNYDNRIPNDNDMAVSNDGKLVSVINSNITMYDVVADSNLFSISLSTFADTLGLPASKYDPRATYDPVTDRFILVYLSGTLDSMSNIVVAFSATSDPTGEWHLYALPGNPFNNGSWSDYPIIAITQQELFITVNAILNDSSWQEGFVESMIWQVRTTEGYAGDTLQTAIYNNVKFNGKPIRNLCPIKGGSSLKGPNQYFMSNRNFDVENDTFFVVEVTDQMTGTPSVQIDFRVSDVKYGVPPMARQWNNHEFDTNDGRVLGGFIEDDKIHFVGNTRDPATGFAAVYHGMVENVSTTKDVTGHILGDQLLDFGYPNISYTGTQAGDDQGIISFSHTSPDTNAGSSAIFYYEGDYSERLNLKTGTSFVDIISGFYERWGDFSGSQPKYNEPGTVWITSNFGRFVNSAFEKRQNSTIVVGISAPNITGISDVNQMNVEVISFPNPFKERFNLSLTTEKTEVLTFILTDIQGRTIKILYHDKVKKGLNNFAFSLEPLSKGTYLLQILNTNQVVETHKIVKQ